MQVKVHKYLFAGTKNIQDRFFEKAQALGFMQCISVTGKKPHLFPDDVLQAKEALKILSVHQKGKQQGQSFQPIIDIVKEVISTRQKIHLNYEKKRALEIELLRLKPFGRFSLEEIHALEEETSYYVQFFMARRESEQKPIPEELIYIQSDLQMDYFLAIGKERFQKNGYSEVVIERCYDTVFLHHQNVITEIEELEKSEISLTSYIQLIEEYIFSRMNSIHLHFAKEDVEYFVEDQLFMIEAWVPETKEKNVQELLDDLSVIGQKVAITKGEEPPTYLENKGFSELGEDLVYLYDTPAVEDKDPSPWVIWFFALFFGMIISDAGYGVIFLTVALCGWMKYGNSLKGVKKRMLTLFTLISCSTIIWGVLVASYFSIKMTPTHFLNRISIPYHLAVEKVQYHKKENSKEYKEWVQEYPEIEDVVIPSDILLKGTKVKEKTKVFQLMNEIYDGILLEISLIVGIFHLTFSFLRNLYRNWGGIGWIATLFGGYLFFPKILGASSMVVYTGLIQRDLSIAVGETLLYGGLGVAVILSMIQAKSFWAISSLFKAIEVFSDVLSYLRLYALGLASVVLAGTFNEIGPAIGGPFFGWIIVLFGHMVNISLGVMAGVIHGLRLNFLEWYHHSYEGGGKKFDPLRLLRKE